MIDLRLKFGMAEAALTEMTCIIVAEALLEGEKKQVGLIVDRVSEVLDIDQDAIEPPDLGSVVASDQITGIAKVGAAVKILLNVDCILFGERLDALVASPRELEPAVS